MRHKNAELLDVVLNRFLRQEGLETPLNEMRVVDAWPEVVGANVARFTGNVRVYNRVLLVEMRSPALRTNLFMARANLVRRLNDFVGADVISDIKFV